MQIFASTMKKIIVFTKNKFEVDGRCMDCLFSGFDRLIQKFHFSYDDRQHFFEYYNHTIARSGGECMPEIHRELNKEFCRISGVSDPYVEEKAVSNKIALGLSTDWRKKVIASENPFEMALRLSIAGNIMDYGPGNSFDLEQTIQQVISAKFAIDNSSLLKQRVKEAKSILYLGDNAGEIVFDKLFIEILMHNHLTFAVKEAPILNDVTLKDAQDIGMDLVCDVVSNGYDASSTILAKCSDEFMEIYNKADLIISKGQGNLEGLLDEKDPRIFFLLMVKCDVMAEILKVDKGSMVVIN